MSSRVLLLLAITIATLSGGSLAIEEGTCDAAGTCSDDSTTTTQQQQSGETAASEDSPADADAVWAEHYKLLQADGNNATHGLQKFYGCPMYSDKFGIDTSKRAKPYSQIPTEETFALFDAAYYHALGKETPPRNEKLIQEEKERREPHKYPPTRGMHVPFEVRWNPEIGRTVHATEFIPAKTKVWTTSHTASFVRDNAPPNFKYVVTKSRPAELSSLFPGDKSLKEKKSNNPHDNDKKKDDNPNSVNTNNQDDEFDYLVEDEYTIDSSNWTKIEELAKAKKEGHLDFFIDILDEPSMKILDESTFTTYRKFVQYLHDHSDETYDWACDALMWSYSSMDDLEDSTVCVNFDHGAMFNDSREKAELETVEGRGCRDDDGWVPPFNLTEHLPRGERERAAECLCFGFFAKRDIHPGEEFRYDYEYFTNTTGNVTDADYYDDDAVMDVVYIDENGNIVNIHDGGDYEIIDDMGNVIGDIKGAK